MIDLILRFLYIGLFTVGGGLAAIPLMQEVIVDAGLLSGSMFYSMIAISESTPGPIGINLATYIGFDRCGVLGGILASLAMALPCFCISCIVARFFQRFSEARIVQTAFVGIRACVTGLIATAAWGILRLNVFHTDVLRAGDWTHFINWKALLIFLALWFAYDKTKKHPIFFIAAGAVIGILLF